MMQSPEEIVRSKLTGLSEMAFARDRALIDELWSERGMLFIGSEAHERFETRKDLLAQLDAIYRKPYRLAWEWKTIRAEARGAILWATVDSDLQIHLPSQARTLPYRVVCIFEFVGERWEWRL